MTERRGKINEFQEQMRTVGKIGKKSGKPTGDSYSKKYIHVLSYNVKKLNKFVGSNPITIEKVNEFTKEYNLQPAMVRSLTTYLRFLGFSKKKLDKLYIPPKKPKKKSLKERILSFKEIKKLFAEAPTLEDRLLLELLYFTAARIGDEEKGILGMTVQNTNLEAMEASIGLKGGLGRTFTIYWEDEQTNQDLIEYIKQNNIKSGRIFKKITPHIAWYRVKQLGKKILNRDVTPHDFRRTCLTHLGKKNVNPLWIQKKAGHKNIQTTMIYVELGQEFAKEATKALTREVEKEGT